ncbi:arylsulfatase [Arenibacter sp. ARW7G5Y1]|uniref:arylsulfatase n=1 Tax=Arenibacter sp. ARW7G5Y1 TaxID=2135619 RepID=UPI000D7752ED|nr:arylsulfatase [Arenibacter sp. ARW7G5Y1]PXX21834.1 arylsulfatase A-like enzyme [Arenibacter sp. ARW7G5Y1]
MKSDFKHLSMMLLAGFLLVSCNSKKETPPNVIVIMTDDQGYGDIAANGNAFVETPNMDLLHSESMRLENFHVNPTCSPTRAQLMTGKYTHRVGVWHTVLGRERIRKTELTMADAFSDNGYATGIFGKWHLGDDYPFRPLDRGFQESVIHKAGSVSQMVDYWDNDRMNDTYFHNNQPTKYSGFSADVFFEEAITFMKKNHNKPFFAYIATSAPHGPNNVLQKWADKYLNKELNENVSNFYASIERVDHNIGVLRDFLKESKLEKNTILIFLTDNGSAMPNNHNKAGMRGSKGSVYEGGHRVPCFIYWPEKNIMGDYAFHELTSVMDLLPTFIDLCNLKVDDNIKFDGQSLKPLLLGKKTDLNERYLLVEQQRLPTPVKWNTNALIHKKWRLINGKELYDMENDFAQKEDVAMQYPEIVKALRKKYEEIWTDISVNDNEYHPLILGSTQAPEILLTAQDWYWKNNNDKPNLIVGQSTVREGKISNGIWPVEIEKAGEYVFELRRWPKESGLSLNATTPEIVSRDNDIELKQWGEKPQGTIYNITSARIKINGMERLVDVNPSAQSVEISMPLKKGLVDVQTWFYTNEGDALGAYYVYVRLKE